MGHGHVTSVGEKESPIQVWDGSTISPSKDFLACEAALQISAKIDGEETPLGILLRTPGNDTALVVGWLLAEGIIKNFQDIFGIEVSKNSVCVTLSPGRCDFSKLLSRKFTISSSCGLCGRETLDGLEIPSRLTLSDTSWIEPDMLANLPSQLTDSQNLFESTGGLHASGLFDSSGSLIELKEDVGRHNALDKLIGSRLELDELPAEKQIVVLSGRIGYELVQKVAFAGIPALAGLGAPSSMAVDAARACGITLIGFLKPSRFNIYSGAWRVVS